MRTIDIHAHWYPAEWLKLFEKDGPKEGATLKRTGSGYQIRTEKLVNAFDERFVGLESRLKKMDEIRRSEGRAEGRGDAQAHRQRLPDQDRKARQRLRRALRRPGIPPEEDGRDPQIGRTGRRKGRRSSAPAAATRSGPKSSSTPSTSASSAWNPA